MLKIKNRYNLTLYMLIGIPCSGKSTYAKKKHSSLNAEIVSNDDIRVELEENFNFSSQNNKRIFENIYDRIENSFIEGNNVIFDANNTNKKFKKRYINLSHKCDAKIIAIAFKTSFRICVKRNEQREHNKKDSN
ncbi:AAA family ATPase [Brassicibacter mesophilus]|uniref:AAA family ATPase n=1 Tax=Brassicibacter mesophilus TaxID=745119 RepID=UPI003D2420B0